MPKSMNALKHGMSAKTLILQNEDGAEFLEILNSYTEFLQPENQVETDLVGDMVAARWRLRRIWRYETAMLDIEMDTQARAFADRFAKADEDMRGSLAFSTCVEKKGYGTALRYEAHLNRAYRRALNELQKLKIAKRDSETFVRTCALPKE